MDLFMARVTKTDDCWLWTGYTDEHGYAYFTLRVDGKPTNHRANRWLYERMVGPIPQGLTLDHTCRVRHCVRPEHQEPVTSKVNIMRGETLAAANAAKTRCPSGHEYSIENTRINRKGSRECRQCNRDRCRRQYRERLVR